MYQLKTIDGRSIINGHEIRVIGSGENGLCSVHNSRGVHVYHGTYEQCAQWLRERGMLVADETATA